MSGDSFATGKDPAAVELGRRGGRTGGKARAKKLSPERRAEIARAGADARWKGKPVVALYDGTLTIGEASFPCAVLEDGTRVLSEQTFMSGMGIYRSGALSKRRASAGEDGARMPLSLAFKNLKPFIDKHLPDVHEPLKYRTMNGNLAHGIPAENIPKICEVWLDARAAGVLGRAQLRVAAKAEIVLRGLAHVGIVALVDEATGYQEVRDRQALQAILDAFLRREFAAWAKRFPDEFYREIFRLRGWKWRGMRVNRPYPVAHYTKDIVYARLAPGILGELEKRNPRKGGRRAAKHHQLLTDGVGHPALAQHLYAVLGLMRASKTWSGFMRLLDAAFPKYGDTLSFEFMRELNEVTEVEATRDSST